MIISEEITWGSVVVVVVGVVVVDVVVVVVAVLAKFPPPRGNVGKASAFAGQLCNGSSSDRIATDLWLTV